MSCDTSSSTVEDGDRGFPAKCHCGKGVVILTSKTKDNPGRPFFRCSTMKDKHLFKWVEDSMYEEVNDALPKISSIEIEIEKAKSEIRFEIEALKCRIHDLEEDALVTKRDLNKGRVMIKCCCVGLICVTIIAIVMGTLVKAKKHKFELGSM